jgi:hypothetical protein
MMACRASEQDMGRGVGNQQGHHVMRTIQRGDKIFSQFIPCPNPTYPDSTDLNPTDLKILLITLLGSDCDLAGQQLLMEGQPMWGISRSRFLRTARVCALALDAQKKALGEGEC